MRPRDFQVDDGILTSEGGKHGDTEAKGEVGALACVPSDQCAAGSGQHRQRAGQDLNQVLLSLPAPDSGRASAQPVCRLVKFVPRYEVQPSCQDDEPAQERAWLTATSWTATGISARLRQVTRLRLRCVGQDSQRERCGGLGAHGVAVAERMVGRDATEYVRVTDVAPEEVDALQGSASQSRRLPGQDASRCLPRQPPCRSHRWHMLSPACWVLVGGCRARADACRA